MILDRVNTLETRGDASPGDLALVGNKYGESLEGIDADITAGELGQDLHCKSFQHKSREWRT